MSAQPSQESEALTSALNAPVCACCGKQSPTSGASECCDGTGRTLTSTTTSGTSELLVSIQDTREMDKAQNGMGVSDAGVAYTLDQTGSQGVARLFTHSHGETYKEAEAAHTLTQQSASETSAMVPLVMQSTSSAEDSPAKTSASQESEPDLRARGQDSSLSSPGSQMSFDQVGSSLRTSLGSSPLPTDETWESFSQRWPKSGTASAGEWSTLDTSEFPSGAVECSLSDVLETTVNERYALSARAARGILRRANARGRELPAELQQALTDLAEAA